MNAYAASPWQKGKKAYDKKEYDMAIYYFKKAIESAPQDGDHFRWLGHAYYRNGQYRDAVGAFKQALNLPHGKNAEHESWDFLIKAYEKLGQTDSIISFREKYVENQPTDYSGFIKLSELYIKNIQYDKAIMAAKRAIELRSDYADAYKNLGVAYGRNNQYNEAIRAYKKAIEIDPKMSLDNAQVGFFLMEQNAYAEAVGAYKKVIEADPSNPDFHTSLALAYYCMGRYDDAIAAVNRAIELESSTQSAKFSFAIRSLIHRSRGNQKESFQDAEKAYYVYTGFAQLTFDRDAQKANHVDGGLTQLSLGRDAEKAYSLDSTNDWAGYSLGAAFLDQEQYDKAIKLLSQLEGPMARLLEATAYAKQGKVKEAATVYISIPKEEMSQKNIPLMNERTALLQIFEPYVKEYRIKARSFEAKEQFKEALSELSEALKMSDETEAQALQESIFSMVRMNPSLSGLPEEARKHVLRGEMLVKEGNLKKAAEEFKQAIGIAPYAARLYYNSALIHAQLKKYPEAIRQMKTYLQAVPNAPDARAAKDEIIKWEFMMEKEGDK